MIILQAFPNEVFNLIIEHLVVVIGIQKAVLLRTVNQRFNAAIMEAICVSQVVDMWDPATPDLVHSINPKLCGKILVVKSRSLGTVNKDNAVSVVANVNRALDAMTGETDQDLLKSRHEAVAEMLSLTCCATRWYDQSIDLQCEAQNLLSGAIIIGDLLIIKSLLANKGSPYSLPALADVNGSTPYFARPLTLAASRGHLEVVCYLLDCGARPDLFSGYDELEDNSRGINGDWNPQQEESLWDLVAYRNSPASALRAAVLGGHEEIVYLLLLEKYRLSSTKIEYLRAIVAGARSGHLHLIQTLFDTIGKRWTDFPGLESEMLREAVRFGQRHVVEMLLDGGVDVNASPYFHYYFGPLYVAASLGNTNMVRFLIERGADIHLVEYSRDDNLPIQGAARCGQEEVVELLLEHNADPVKAIKSAAHAGQFRVIKMLLEKFADLIHREGGDVGRSVLWNSVIVANLTAITTVVEGGVSLNEGYDHADLLPINLAKKCPVPSVVNHLIALGAQDTDTVAKWDDNPLTYRRVHLSERTREWISKY